ncbi:PREDICTED: putative late blight resistance protein homolog R1B-23 [Ipomoea nil]|uniref:putative late blight resistance protein homolog R1B-23 n=1 Tax=Ipomoea nil TaxID=35883 RepID=UPI000901897B|nr:PREDICTED: putative late blight resistance protein homolog R1B-23 [Ipomoea nil]
MAWFAATSLMRTIELEFLQPHPRLVLDHTETEAVEALHRRLAQMLAFLDNVSENQLNDDDETTKEWKGRIKEVALRIEHKIESEIIDVFGREDPRWRFLGRVDDCIQPQRFLTTLQNGSGEFMELVKNKQRMKDLQIKDDDIPSSSSEKIEHHHHSASSKLLWSSIMVGRHDEVNMISELLVQDSWKERRVVPIVGMGGIGKTKLAQTLYQHPTVSSHFDVVAWTTVSAQPVMRQMLLQLLSTMQISQEKEIINKSNEELADRLRRCLMGRRYFIVVDDLWSTDFWDEIQRCFPEDSNGSRILVTTRLQEVAISTGGSHNYWLNLPFLNPDESWELFNQWILNYGSLSLSFPMKLEGIWRHIVEYCKGLPLAIVIVAGLVQAINESLWESQSEEIEKILCATVTNSLLDSFSEILRLSYNHLPNVLRVCFLYVGVFREDSAIPMKKLIRLWIAEGFVKVEEDAEDYLKDLILLRYIALRPSKSLNSLPVLKDWNLQTLVLLESWGCSSTSADDDPNPLIPAEIWELPKLRHLQVCTTFVLGTPTAVHQYIQTVQWLRPFQCTEQVFLRIPNAKVMGVFMEGSVEFGEPNCLDNLRYLHQLEELKIESRHSNPVLLPVVDAFPVQLKKLKLKGTLVPWDAMTVIGMLPNLQLLKLINGACQGQHWELSEASFPQLKSLLIYGSDLRHWEATSNDFPVLERLILKQCYELEAIPSSFEDILTLELIELCHCYSRLVNSANQIQQVQRDYGNNELVVCAYNIWRNAEEVLEGELKEELEG